MSKSDLNDKNRNANDENDENVAVDVFVDLHCTSLLQYTHSVSVHDL